MNSTRFLQPRTPLPSAPSSHPIMHMRVRVLVLVLVIVIGFTLYPSSAQATTFYVSNNGSDDANGQSPQSPWATLNHVNEAPLQPGDAVLFQRGGQWRGRLLPPSGAPDAPITYAAYGEGPKPLLLGSLEKNNPADWQDMGNNIWATAEPTPGDINVLPNGSFADNLSAWTRHTESGAVIEVARDASTFDSAPAGLSLHCTQAATLSTHIQLYTAGVPITRNKLYQLSFRAKCTAALHIPPPVLMQRNAPWSHYGTPLRQTPAAIDAEWSTYRIWYTTTETSSDARLTFFLGGVLPSGATLWLDSLRFAECSGEMFQADVGNIIFDHEASVGVKVWNREDLDTQGEFWFDKETWRLHLLSEGNPAERYSDIECAVNKHIINQGKRHYLTFQNLAVKYGAAHGVGGGDTHHIIVRDCEFSYIGGGELHMGDRIVRFGNAVEFWGPAHDNLVERCRIWEIYDTGLSNQSSVPNAEQYNIRYRNNVVWNCEWLYEYWGRPENSSTHDIYFENNTCAFAGGGWGHAQRGDPHGRGVGMSRTQAKLSNVFIRNNIFLESTQFLCDMAGWKPEEIATVTLDHNCWFMANGAAFRFGAKNYDVSQFAAYQGESGRDAHSIWADPLFEDAANGDFRLRKDSPCIDAGTAVERDADFAGTPVPQGPAPDIGAYEYIAGTK